jgi:hypothetical protein
VTLIASVLTHDFVAHVSDRRLVNGQTGKPVEDEATKAIQFARHTIWGYTGLADIHGAKTDYWILERLKPNVTETVVRIRDDATREFASIRLSTRLKRHTFVGVGWEVPPGGAQRPVRVIVTNAQAADGMWFERAAKRFNVHLFRLPEGEPLSLHTAGQPLTEDERRRLERNLRRALGHGRGAILRLLVDAVRDVAQRNPRVGDRLLAGLIPSTAPRTPGAGVTMPLPGAAASPDAADEADEPMFFYVRGQGSAEYTLYGPHWTDGNMQIAEPRFTLGGEAEGTRSPDAN